MNKARQVQPLAVIPDQVFKSKAAKTDTRLYPIHHIIDVSKAIMSPECEDMLILGRPKNYEEIVKHIPETRRHFSFLGYARTGSASVCSESDYPLVGNRREDIKARYERRMVCRARG